LSGHYHGTGVMRFTSGQILEGEFIRGKVIQGKLTYKNDGSTYEGSWMDYTRHGRGKACLPDGSYYEGDF
jgi:hypothetical protein